MPQTWIRPAEAADAASFVEIETDAYRPEYLEDGDTFLAKVAAYPRGRMIIEEEDEPIGYVVCHPWTAKRHTSSQCAGILHPTGGGFFFLAQPNLEKGAPKNWAWKGRLPSGPRARMRGGVP